MSEYKGHKPGYGALFRNGFKEAESHPDYKGTLTFDKELLAAAKEDGELELSAWKKQTKNKETYLSLTVKEKYKPKKNSSSDELDEEL